MPKTHITTLQQGKHKWKHLQHFEVQKTHSKSKSDKTHMKDPRKCSFHINGNNNKKDLGWIVCISTCIPMTTHVQNKVQQILPSTRNLNLQKTLNIHHIHLLPILPIHNHISKLNNFHGIVILSKHPNNQIKGIGQSSFELKLGKKQRWEATFIFHAT